MNISKKTIFGDFLDGYAYNSSLYLLSMDHSFVKLDISILSKDELQFHDLVKAEINKKVFSMNQLMTDFTVYEDHVYYCNSDGVFDLKMKQEIENRKIWDAAVQCITVGENGRVAMSASDDGLFEYDIPGKGVSVRLRNRDEYVKSIERNIFQISSDHSTSCKWTNGGSIWNYSLVGKSLFYECVTKKSGKEKIIDFIEEYGEKQIFSNIIEGAFITLSESCKEAYRLSKQTFEIFKFKQGKDDILSWKKRTTFKDCILRSTRVSEFAVLTVKSGDKAFPLYVIENEECIFVMNERGENIYTISPVEEVVRWRVFQNSVKYRNLLEVVFDDRIELISFSVT